ncbi:MAG: nucleoside hydrolase [Acidobacteria bacterium]|nr:nucleoside hydrolase [Acidobacteriota bacterium]
MIKKLLVLLLAVAFLLSATPAQASPNEARKVILDVDPGADDAMAILLALNSPELDVRALTVVAGNVVVGQGVENALKMVSLAGRCDIPVARGAEKPLEQKLTTAEFFHGKNGLGNADLPAAACKVDARPAADLIVELVNRYPREITLVPVGPLTNIALALKKDPSIATKVKKVVLMGGSIAGGNATAVAEANIYNDPEAALAVFEAGWPLTMVGLNVTERTLFTRAELGQLAKEKGQQARFATAVLTFLVDLAEKLGGEGTPMHDPLAVGAVIDRTLIVIRDMRVDIETRGEYTRGETVASRHNCSDRRELRGDHYAVVGIETVQPNVHVAVESDGARFNQLFLARLRGK